MLSSTLRVPILPGESGFSKAIHRRALVGSNSPGSTCMVASKVAKEEDEDYMPPNYGQTDRLEPPGVRQNHFFQRQTKNRLNC